MNKKAGELSAYLNYLSNERNYSENTVKSYSRDISQFLEFAGGAINITP
ncbi:MAG: site-specific integrase, partial [Candidatus Goldiibacteriota bacterium]